MGEGAHSSQVRAPSDYGFHCCRSSNVTSICHGSNLLCYMPVSIYCGSQIPRSCRTFRVTSAPGCGSPVSSWVWVPEFVCDWEELLLPSLCAPDTLATLCTLRILLCHTVKTSPLRLQGRQCGSSSGITGCSHGPSGAEQDLKPLSALSIQTSTPMGQLGFHGAFDFHKLLL